MTTRYRSVIVAASVALAIVVGFPAASRADSIIGGFVGMNSGGNVGEDRPITWGGSVGGFGRLIGFEIEFARTADFFQTDDTLGAKTSVTTVMGNLVLGGGGVGVRPYASAGFGLLRLNVNEAGDLFDDLSRNDFGVNAGGGVLVSVARSFAIRGDVRYFRSLRSADEDDDIAGTRFDLADFRYWRGSVGVVLRF